MMNAGIATQADLEEAERIFTLLKQTKIQEYEHMLTLCERRDTRLFEKYHFKHNHSGLYRYASVSDV